MPNYDTSSSEEDYETTVLGKDVIYLTVLFFESEKGPKQRILALFKPSNPELDRLMSYLYYLLSRTSGQSDRNREFTCD